MHRVRMPLLNAAMFACASLLAIGCGDAVTTDTDVAELQQESHSDKDLQWWRAERAERQAAIDAYIADNYEDYDSFKNTPLGNTGVPTIMLRLFPEIFPEIWGPYEAGMPIQGFSPDGLEPDRVLPLGLGHMDSGTVLAGPPDLDAPVFLQSSSLSCAGCHLGRVDGPDGETIYLPGAPNGQFGPFRGSVYATVSSCDNLAPDSPDCRYNGDTFRAALAALPPGSIYPNNPLQEQVERAAFDALADVFLANLRAGSVAGAARYAATVGKYTFGNVANPPAPAPGNLDALAAGFALVVDPANFDTEEELRAVLADAPAPVDIMAVWDQANRPAAQWDGSIAGKLHRNLAASLGVIGNPGAVNVDNGIRTTRFTENLPPPPYPFDVSYKKAKKGKKLYKKYCADCHESDSTELDDLLFDIAEVGTDPNRGLIWTDYVVNALGAAVEASCQGDPACDGEPSPVIVNTEAYMAVPLTGIWATAPYLHNGSVPTLRALITGERPDTFFRGNTSYDQEDVGFTWTEATSITGTVFDTAQSGNSNAGHYYGPMKKGKLAWKKKDVDALLEYMKTL